MPNQRYLALGLLLLLGLGSSPAVAQRFEEPTKEELEMVSDPQAPEAPAEFLAWEQKTDNAGHFVSTYARIKVFTQPGREWATVAVPYDPQLAAPPIIEGRTIHRDGTVIPLPGRGADALTFKSVGAALRQAYFTLPGAEVGSILEYRWTVPFTNGKLPFVVSDPAKPLYASLMAKATPTWEVQQRIPVHKASFYFNPFTLLESGDKTVLNNTTEFTGLVDGERATNLLYTERLPQGVHVVKSPKGEYFLDLEGVPALSSEPDALPDISRAYRVEFYYAPYAFPEVYWESEIRRWAKQLARSTAATSGLRDAASHLCAGADTAPAKARRLYDAVQGLKGGGRAPIAVLATGEQADSTAPAANAQEVWDAQGGTSNDLAMLYLALARAAGLDARGMRVASRDLHYFDGNYLSLSQLDALLVIVRIDGREVFLDPGERLCPFGQLLWSHALAGGIDESAKAPTYTPAGDSKDAITAHTADLTLDGEGNATGTVKILMNGPEALHWRRKNLAEGGAALKQEMEPALEEVLPAAMRAEVTGVEGLETPAGYVAITMRVTGRLGRAEGPRLRLPAFFFSTGSLPAFAAAEIRASAVDLRYAGQTIDDVVYHLPAGYSLEGVPPAAQIPWPGHALLVVKTEPGPGSISIKHIYARAFAVVDAKEYPGLRAYYQKVAENDRQQLVLAQGSSSGH